MIYLRFSTQAEAVAAVAQIDSNFRSAIQAYNPEAICPNGFLIGRNAATGELAIDRCRTQTWAIPQECVGGWVVPKPEGDLGRPEIFGGVDLLAGLQAFIEDENPEFPALE